MYVCMYLPLHRPNSIRPAPLTPLPSPLSSELFTPRKASSRQPRTKQHYGVPGHMWIHITAMDICRDFDKIRL